MKNIRATIDIGSNTVLLLLGEVNPYKEIAKISEVTSLGKGLDRNGRFADESMDASYAALAKYKGICLEHGVRSEEIITTATEAARVAQNAKEFFTKIQQELGITVQIITGEAEAALTTRGVLFDTNFEKPEVFVMDIGGASTELIKVDTVSKSVKQSISLPVGAVRVTDWLVEGTFPQRLGHIFSTNSALIDDFRTITLFCVAGTLTSLGNMHLGHSEFVENEVHGLHLATSDIDQLLQSYGHYSPAQFLAKFPFLGKRSNAILGGLTLVHHMLHRLGVKEVVVSTYGLRYGTFLEGGIKDGYLAR